MIRSELLNVHRSINQNGSVESHFIRMWNMQDLANIGANSLQVLVHTSPTLGE